MNAEIDVRKILPIASQRAHLWVIGMEQLWNRGGATGGKHSGRPGRENGLNQRQTVARLPFGWHARRGLRFESGRGRMGRRFESTFAQPEMLREASLKLVVPALVNRWSSPEP